RRLRGPRSRWWRFLQDADLALPQLQRQRRDARSELACDLRTHGDRRGRMPRRPFDHGVVVATPRPACAVDGDDLLSRHLTEENRASLVTADRAQGKLPLKKPRSALRPFADAGGAPIDLQAEKTVQDATR